MVIIVPLLATKNPLSSYQQLTSLCSELEWQANVNKLWTPNSFKQDGKLLTRTYVFCKSQRLAKRNWRFWIRKVAISAMKDFCWNWLFLQKLCCSFVRIFDDVTDGVVFCYCFFFCFEKSKQNSSWHWLRCCKTEAKFYVLKKIISTKNSQFGLFWKPQKILGLFSYLRNL